MALPVSAPGDARVGAPRRVAAVRYPRLWRPLLRARLRTLPGRATRVAVARNHLGALRAGSRRRASCSARHGALRGQMPEAPAARRAPRSPIGQCQHQQYSVRKSLASRRGSRRRPRAGPARSAALGRVPARPPGRGAGPAARGAWARNKRTRSRTAAALAACWPPRRRRAGSHLGAPGRAGGRALPARPRRRLRRHSIGHGSHDCGGCAAVGVHACGGGRAEVRWLRPCAGCTLGPAAGGPGVAAARKAREQSRSS